MGFPIRKFSDQSLFAAPRNLSQRTTSFIASQRQGIHQIPLRHLIALIAKARFFQEPPIGKSETNALRLEKTSFASNASGDLSGQAPNPRLVLERQAPPRRHPGRRTLPSSFVRTSRFTGPRPNALPLHDVRYQKAFPQGAKPLNQRFQTENAAASRRSRPRIRKRNRSDCIGKDRRFTGQWGFNSNRFNPANPAFAAQAMVEPDGIEPTTSCLQSTRSPN